MSFLVNATLGLYAAVSLVYVVYLLRRSQRIVTVARWGLVVTLVVHLATIGLFCVHGLHPMRDTGGALNLIALVLVGGYLATSLRWPLGALGAMVTPLALALVFSSQLTPRETPAGYGAGLPVALGYLHLSLVALGVAAFALAAAVALLYLVQERALRANRVGALYGRTPPLATLDQVGRRLIAVGFPIYTFAVATGFWWMSRIPHQRSFRVEYGISAVIWGVFAALILTRWTVGIGGRRAAVLTLVGFIATVVVLSMYIGRKVVGA